MSDLNKYTKWIDGPVDYSPEFSAVARAVAKRISDHTGLVWRHDEDMNYSAGQRLNTTFSPEGSPIAREDETGTFMVIIYLSSRAKVWSVLVRQLQIDKKYGSIWNTAPLGAERPWLLKAIRAVSEVLHSLGWIRIADSELDAVVEGHVTELDGKPATLFEVLFSELP